MKTLLNLVLLFGLICASTAYASQLGNDKAAKEVEALERQRFEAQVKKDYTFLAKAFADDSKAVQAWRILNVS